MSTPSRKRRAQQGAHLSRRPPCQTSPPSQRDATRACTASPALLLLPPPRPHAHACPSPEQELRRAVEVNKKNEAAWAAQRERMKAIAAKRGAGNEFAAPALGAAQKRPLPPPTARAPVRPPPLRHHPLPSCV